MSFSRSETVKARKRYVCEGCNQPIQKEERYRYSVVVSDITHYRIYACRYHLHCHAAMDEGVRCGQRGVAAPAGERYNRHK
jgi:hypothetical protein